MTGLRERNKTRRRAAILEATRQIIREGEAEAISVERIAALAEVSPATVYNLVGTRQELWAALVEELLDRLDAALSATVHEDPVERARTAISISIRLLCEDPEVYRRVLTSWGITGRIVEREPQQIQIRAMRAAIAAGLLRRDLDPRVLGDQVLASYEGAMQRWAQGLVDDATFERQSLHGLAVVLAAAAAEPHRERFVAELRAIGRRLVREGRARSGRRRAPRGRRRGAADASH